MTALAAIGVAVVVAVTMPAPARADAAADRAKAHFKRAKNLYDLGEYRQAMDAFKAGYQEKEDPIFLYNVAQCHRMLGESAEAIRMYRSYLRNAPGAPNRAEVDKRIDEMEKLVAGGGPAAVAPPPAAPTPPPPTPAVPTPPPSPAPSPVPSPSPSVAPLPAAPPPVEPAAATPPPPQVETGVPPAPIPPPAGTEAGLSAAPGPAAGEESPVYARWWFWTAIGVVLIGGVAFAATRGGKNPTEGTDLGTHKPKF